MAALAAAPPAARAMAQAGRALARALNRAELQRAMWVRLLGVASACGGSVGGQAAG
jgi:hypothetical protein